MPNQYLSGSLTCGNMGAISFVPQNESGFVVSKDFESFSENIRVELMEENFEAIREMEDSNKWDGTYEANSTA